MVEKMSTNNNIDIKEFLKTYFQIEKEILSKEEFKEEIYKELKENIKKYPIDPQKFIEVTNKNYNNDLMFVSYPKENLLILLLNNIYLCIQNKKFVFHFFLLNSFNEITNDNIIILQNLFSQNLISLNSLDLKALTDNFNPRLLLTLLGVRQTVGSLNNHLPPDINILKSKFIEKNNPKSILTVGARALCKHCHRSVTDPFWPIQKGKDKEKNDNANIMLNLFLENCIWINIHGLPHQIGIIELRNDKGYGIRWEVESCFFRGFLEPQIENGHEKHWIH
jgi:hypothetical protein